MSNKVEAASWGHATIEDQSAARDIHISQIVGECAGAVSVCWSDIDKAGVFDSSQAAKHVEDAVAEIIALIAEAAK